MNSLKKTEKLKSGIEKLGKKIKEKELSLPAHSIKPLMLQELEELEDELDSKRKMIKKLLGARNE